VCGIVGNKLKFKLNETLDDVFANIIKTLPDVKTEWEMIEDEQKKCFFSTMIGSVKIDVHETFVEFTLKYKTLAEETKKYQRFQVVGKTKKPLKVNLFSALQRKFGEKEDYIFYKRVLRSLNGQVNLQNQKAEHTFTENDDRREDSLDN
jgi:hypothetical protein